MVIQKQNSKLKNAPRPVSALDSSVSVGDIAFYELVNFDQRFYKFFKIIQVVLTGSVAERFGGIRVSFGYPACPRLFGMTAIS